MITKKNFKIKKHTLKKGVTKKYKLKGGSAKKINKAGKKTGKKEPSKQNLVNTLNREFSSGFFLTDDIGYSPPAPMEQLKRIFFQREIERNNKKVNKLSSVGGIQKQEKSRGLMNAIGTGLSEGRGAAATAKSFFESTRSAISKGLGQDVPASFQGLKSSYNTVRKSGKTHNPSTAKSTSTTKGNGTAKGNGKAKGNIQKIDTEIEKSFKKLDVTKLKDDENLNAIKLSIEEKEKMDTISMKSLNEAIVREIKAIKKEVGETFDFEITTHDNCNTFKLNFTTGKNDLDDFKLEVANPTPYEVPPSPNEQDGFGSLWASGNDTAQPFGGIESFGGINMGGGGRKKLSPLSKNIKKYLLIKYLIILIKEKGAKINEENTKIKDLMGRAIQRANDGGKEKFSNIEIKEVYDILKKRCFPKSNDDFKKALHYWRKGKKTMRIERLGEWQGAYTYVGEYGLAINHLRMEQQKMLNSDAVEYFKQSVNTEYATNEKEGQNRKKESKTNDKKTKINKQLLKILEEDPKTKEESDEEEKTKIETKYIKLKKDYANISLEIAGMNHAKSYSKREEQAQINTSLRILINKYKKFQKENGKNELDYLYLQGSEDEEEDEEEKGFGFDNEEEDEEDEEEDEDEEE